MTNEKQTQNEIAETQDLNSLYPTVIVRENEDFVIKKENGKFVRKAKYKDFSSVSAETREDKIWLMNLLDGDEESSNGLKAQVGKQIVVANIITRTYDRINEETGDQEYGVLTYLITPEKVAYITSSKSVYFTINRVMELFGTPKEDTWENVTVKVYKEKGTNGDAIKIKMVG